MSVDAMASSGVRPSRGERKVGEAATLIRQKFLSDPVRQKAQRDRRNGDAGHALRSPCAVIVAERPALATRRAAMRAGVRDTLGWQLPRERPPYPTDGIYALREWIELVGPRHRKLDELRTAELELIPGAFFHAVPSP